MGRSHFCSQANLENYVLVLDEPGAERLLGRGHLAANLSGEGKVILAQVPFASSEEIGRACGIDPTSACRPGFGSCRETNSVAADGGHRGGRESRSCRRL